MTMPKSTHARQNSRGKPVTGSIKRKLFFQIVAILLLSAALILFVNSRLLSQVYIWQEKDNLQQAARSISEMDQTADDFREQLSSLATKYNITAEIIDSAGRVVWATIYDPYYYSSRIPLLNSDVLLQFKHNLTTLEREPRDDGSYFEVREGRSHDIQYLVFGLPTDSGQTVEVFAQKNVIESNALLANNLFGAITVIIMLSAIVLAAWYANKFTRPLIAMNQVTRGMAQMNFSRKCAVKGKDELSELARSINVLSDSLDATLKDLQQKNQQLEADIEKERRTEQIRKEFVSNVSHELKTPIAIIQGYAEGLQLGVAQEPGQIAEYCGVIMDETKRMNRMVMELLELSRYEAGAYQLHEEPFFIHALVDEFLSARRLLFAENGITVETDIPLTARGYGDTEKLTTVLNNYVMNAVSHAAGEKRIMIDCVDAADKRYRIRVFNTGEPIAQDELDKIWISFHRADKSRKRGSEQRYGLGLSIVRALQELYGCGYGCENKENGVQFWFDIKKAEEALPSPAEQPGETIPPQENDAPAKG